MTNWNTPLFKCLKKESLRLDRERLNLHFLKSCRNAGTIPNFIRIGRTKSRAKFNALRLKFESKCLALTIREKYSKVSFLEVKVGQAYEDLKGSQLPVDFEESIRVIEYFKEKQRLRITSTHIKKLGNLMNKQENRTCPQPQPVDYVNISSRTFDSSEDAILRKGPKHITQRPLRPMNVVPFFEDIIKEVDPDHKEEARNKLFFEFKSAQKRLPPTSMNEFRILRDLRKDPSIRFLQTDKTNKIAVLDTTDYKSKMVDCINSMGCTSVQGNPLNKLVAKVRELVKFGKWPDSMRSMIKENKTSIIPVMFARLKDHKANHPLRPIVPKTQGPTYYLEKAYVGLLKILLPPSPYVIASTKHFVQELEDYTLPSDFIMASVDVVQLYPSIDVNIVKPEIISLINASPVFQPGVKLTLIRCLNLILSSNFFCFDGVIYDQPRGAPMGSPISGYLAEFVLRPIDFSVNTTMTLRPGFWRRYVDDVFVIWPHSLSSFNDFCTHLNSINPTISFTNQVEKDGCLPFLDVLLQRMGTSITRTVYRKPMASSSTIQGNAAAPRSYKMAAYSSYVTRAKVVCSPALREQEYQRIRSIALENGFTPEIINTIIEKQANRIIRTGTSPPKKRIPIPYVPHFHEKVKHYFDKLGLDLVAITSRKLAAFLNKGEDDHPRLLRKGVYEIPYTDSAGKEGFYVGMTCRKLEQRLKEHDYDIRSGKLTTALARKFASENIQIKFDEARVIAPYDTYFRTIVRESIIIMEREHEVCNEQVSFCIPKLWAALS